MPTCTCAWLWHFWKGSGLGFQPLLGFVWRGIHRWLRSWVWELGCNWRCAEQYLSHDFLIIDCISGPVKHSKAFSLVNPFPGLVNPFPGLVNSAFVTVLWHAGVRRGGNEATPKLAFSLIKIRPRSASICKVSSTISTMGCPMHMISSHLASLSGPPTQLPVACSAEKQQESWALQVIGKLGGPCE